MKPCFKDPSRPCGSRAQASNRYRREELEEMVRRCGVDVDLPDGRLSLDELCALLDRKFYETTTPTLLPAFFAGRTSLIGPALTVSGRFDLAGIRENLAKDPNFVLQQHVFQTILPVPREISPVFDQSSAFPTSLTVESAAQILTDPKALAGVNEMRTAIVKVFGTDAEIDRLVAEKRFPKQTGLICSMVGRLLASTQIFGTAEELASLREAVQGTIQGRTCEGFNFAGIENFVDAFLVQVNKRKL